MDKDRIWTALFMSDPAYTKPVPGRGGFTTIDAQWCRQRMCQHFGPEGIGWGMSKPEFESFPLAGQPHVKVEFHVWYIDPDTLERAEPLHTVAAIELVSNKGKPDTDAFKKVVTDGMSKALSRIGLGADVFLGLHDDPGYVAHARDIWDRRMGRGKYRGKTNG